MPMDRRFGQRADTLSHDHVIGAAGAEAVEAERRIGFQFRGKAGHFGKKRIGFLPRSVLHPLGDCGQTILDPANFRRERLRQWQAEHGKGAIGFDVE